MFSGGLAPDFLIVGSASWAFCLPTAFSDKAGAAVEGGGWARSSSSGTSSTVGRCDSSWARRASSFWAGVWLSPLVEASAAIMNQIRCRVYDDSDDGGGEKGERRRFLQQPAVRI